MGNCKMIAFYSTQTMIRSSIFKLALFMLVLVLRPTTESPVIPVVPVPPFAPRPLCNFQMALANQACAYLPFIQVPPQAPRAPLTPPPPPDEETHEHRHGHGHGHGHEHDHDNDNEHDHEHQGNNNHGHGHRHHRRHRHHHHHKDTPVEEQCCKWLSQVDDQCVCELLVRLPPFLARPVHRFSVIVGSSCNITYICGSRFRV